MKQSPASSGVVPAPIPSPAAAAASTGAAPCEGTSFATFLLFAHASVAGLDGTLRPRRQEQEAPAAARRAQPTQHQRRRLLLCRQERGHRWQQQQPVDADTPLPHQAAAGAGGPRPVTPPPSAPQPARKHRVPLFQALSAPASPRSPSRFALLKASLLPSKVRYSVHHLSHFTFLSFDPRAELNYNDDGDEKRWIDSFSSLLIWLTLACCLLFSGASKAKPADEES